MVELDPLIDVLENSPNVESYDDENLKIAHVKDIHFEAVCSLANRRDIEFRRNEMSVTEEYDHYITWEE